MTMDSCTRERNVLERITADQWPQCVDAELLAHVDACPVCRDVVTVALVMRDEHVQACRDAHVPSAGLVWWRAERRARQEAARLAARPMTFVQVVAAACGLAAALTLAGLASPWLRGVFAALVDEMSAFDWPMVSLPALPSVAALVSQGGVPLLLAAGVWLVLAPIALYFALSRE